jgi:hypothetical protein
MEAIGAEQLAIYVADLQEKLKIKQTAQALSDNCRAILIWYCELLLLKCVPLYLSKLPFKYLIQRTT